MNWFFLLKCVWRHIVTAYVVNSSILKRVPKKVLSFFGKGSVVLFWLATYFLYVHQLELINRYECCIYLSL